jgi:hypothetical protein
MKFDVQKIDERIKKLQELRRLATDPEIASLLSEFVTVGEERMQPSEPPISMPTNVQPIEMPGPEATNDLVKEVVNGVDTPSNGGLWSRRGRLSGGPEQR